MVEASEKASRYEWTAAANLYKQALDKLEPDSGFLETANVAELLGESRYRAAFQSAGREEFKQKMRLAEEADEKAATLYEKLGSDALSKMLRARAVFASLWIEDKPSDRRGLIQKCIEVSDEAVKSLEVQGDKRRLAEAHKDLLTYLSESLPLANERSLIKERFERAIETVEKAIAEFEPLAQAEALVETLNMAISVLAGNAFKVDQVRSRELELRAVQLGKKLAEASDRAKTPYALALAEEGVGLIAWLAEGDPAKGLSQFETAIVMAQDVKDSYLHGRLLTHALNSSFWAEILEDYVDRKRKLLEKGMEFASRAIKKLEIPLHDGLLESVYYTYAECHTHLALDVETDVERKRARLREAIGIARQFGAHMYYGAVASSGHPLSKALFFLASLTVDTEEKTRLLKEALPIREETVRTSELLFPDSWYAGLTTITWHFSRQTCRVWRRSRGRRSGF